MFLIIFILFNSIYSHVECVFLFQEPEKLSFYFLNKTSFIVVVFYPETVFFQKCLQQLLSTI